MDTNTSGIQQGMDVYGADGQKIGSVDDILNVAAYSQTGAGTSYAGTPSTGAQPNTGFTGGTGPTGEGSYLKVDQGGILGIGATELYVPFSSVTDIVPGDRLTLDCTKDTCGDLYGKKPEFLS